MKTSKNEKSENNVGPAGAAGGKQQASSAFIQLADANFKTLTSKQAGPEERTFGREMDINNGEAAKAGTFSVSLKGPSPG